MPAPSLTVWRFIWASSGASLNPCHLFPAGPILYKPWLAAPPALCGP